MAAAMLPRFNTAQSLPNKTSRGEKLLLIEDDEDAMHWVRHALKQYAGGKYKLEWRECLSDALKRLSDGGIDLILLDLGLPDCASPFTRTWVRQAAPKVPIIVLTGDDSEDRNDAAFTRNREKYLVKGHISCSELVEAIGDSLSSDKPPNEQPHSR